MDPDLLATKQAVTNADINQAAADAANAERLRLKQEQDAAARAKAAEDERIRQQAA